MLYTSSKLRGLQFFHHCITHNHLNAGIEMIRSNFASIFYLLFIIAYCIIYPAVKTKLLCDVYFVVYFLGTGYVDEII